MRPAGVGAMLRAQSRGAHDGKRRSMEDRVAEMSRSNATRRGSVLKDKARGTWYFVIDVPGPNGKRAQHFERGFPRERDGLAALDAFRAQLAMGRVPVPDDESVAAFAKSWVAALPT